MLYKFHETRNKLISEIGFTKCRYPAAFHLEHELKNIDGTNAFNEVLIISMSTISGGSTSTRSRTEILCRKNSSEKCPRKRLILVYFNWHSIPCGQPMHIVSMDTIQTNMNLSTFISSSLFQIQISWTRRISLSRTAQEPLQ